MRLIRFVNDAGGIALGDTDDLPHESTLVEPDTSQPAGYRRTNSRQRIRRVLSPVAPTNIFGIGLNYRRHAAESGMAAPASPVVFMKPTTSVVGPDDPVEFHRCCDPAGEIDYEAELAVVIGRTARDVSRNDALKFVAGYTAANDISARTLQLKSPGGQWVRGKSLDGFCPLGPVLVTPDEIPDPQSLRLRTRFNGQILQESSTSDMIFSVAEIISFLSQGLTLIPGTVILTGTPEGVGFTRKPPIYLRPGDEVTIEIDGIGALRNPIVKPKVASSL